MDLNKFYYNLIILLRITQLNHDHFIVNSLVDCSSNNLEIYSNINSNTHTTRSQVPIL